MEPPIRQAVSRKACVNPTKFHYAKHSDETLDDSLSKGFENHPGSHLRGVEDISPGSHKPFRIVGDQEGGIESVSTSGISFPTTVTWL